MARILGTIASSFLLEPDPSFESIATTTLSTSAATINITSIPTTYTHLHLRILTRLSVAGISQNVLCKFNGDGTSANYYRHGFSGEAHTNIASAASDPGTADGFYALHTVGNAGISNYIAPSIMDILDYSNTGKVKTIKVRTGFVHENTGGGDETQIRFTTGWYNSTSAITSLLLTPAAGNFMAKTQVALYGIKESV